MVRTVKYLAAAIAVAVVATAIGQSNNLLRWFGPATGVLVGTAGSPQTRVATSTDIAALVVSGSATTGHCVQFASSTTFSDTGSACGSGGGGGVSSVALTMPSGFSVSGSPVTSSGTFAVSGGPFVQLGQVVASGSPATLTVSGIPGTYTNLEIVITGRCDAAAQTESIITQFNGDTGTNYDSVGNSTTGTSNNVFQSIGTASPDAGFLPCASATANRSSVTRLIVGDYASTVFDKLVAGQTATTQASSGGNVFTQISTVVWRPSTPAAITSVTVSLASGNFVTGSKLTVYGLQ